MIPLVHVYIPTFNRVDLLLSRALPSVLRQSYPYFTVIVAAHGCTDGTVDAVRRLGNPAVRVIEVPRRQTYPSTAMNHWLAGPVAPANAALRECRGDWIARLDDDDEWEPHHLHMLLGVARASNYEFISSAHATPDGKVQPYVVNGIRIGGVQTWVYRSYLRFMRFNPDCWRKTTDRPNDIDLQRRFVRAGVRMGYLDEVTCRVSPRPGETLIGSKAYLANPEVTERRLAF
jgi:glycosyltransferase involved in cell wall biosynthesis